MQYVDIAFPECIAFGAQSDPTWETVVTVNTGGYENTNQNWSHARHVYDVSFSVRTASDYLLIRNHFHEVRGRARSFPFKDFLDFEASAANGAVLSLALAAPAASGTYYLFKVYGSTQPYRRRITRPDNPVAVYRTRSGVTTDITGTDAVVTYTTGAVAIANHVAGDTYAWAGSFKVPCRYESDRLPAAAVNKGPGEAGELLVTCGAITVIEVRE
jgi:uncharacterized protein (TIGR02217 family)